MLPSIVLLFALTQGPQVALRGLDPVALCGGEERPGQANLELRAGRYTYRFATLESRARFAKSPERFGIQWGGGCGRMGPLSGRGDAQRFLVRDGRIYIFASDGCREGFLSRPERFVAPPPPPPDPDEAARAAGLERIARAVRAHGLPPRKEALSLRFLGTAEQSGWTHERELVCDAEGRVLRRSAWTPPAGEKDASAFDTRWVVVPGAAADAFTVEDGDVFDLGQAERADSMRYALREPVSLLALRGREDFSAHVTSQGELVVHVAGLSTTLHLDAGGRIGSIAWRGRLGDGVTSDVLEVFSDERDVDGLVVPFSREVRLDGEVSEASSGNWDSVQRATASAARFQRP